MAARKKRKRKEQSPPKGGNKSDGPGKFDKLTATKYPVTVEAAGSWTPSSTLARAERVRVEWVPAPIPGNDKRVFLSPAGTQTVAAATGTSGVQVPKKGWVGCLYNRLVVCYGKGTMFVWVSRARVTGAPATAAVTDLPAAIAGVPGPSTGLAIAAAPSVVQPPRQDGHNLRQR